MRTEHRVDRLIEACQFSWHFSRPSDFGASNSQRSQCRFAPTPSQLRTTVQLQRGQMLRWSYIAATSLPCKSGVCERRRPYSKIRTSLRAVSTHPHLVAALFSFSFSLAASTPLTLRAHHVTQKAPRSFCNVKSMGVAAKTSSSPQSDRAKPNPNPTGIQMPLSLNCWPSTKKATAQPPYAFFWGVANINQAHHDGSYL